MRHETDVDRRAGRHPHSATALTTVGGMQLGREVDRRRIDEQASLAQGGRDSGDLLGARCPAGGGGGHPVPVEDPVGELGSHADAVRLRGPGICGDAAESLRRSGRGARGARRVVRELRAGEVQFRLPTSLQHAVRSEHPSHPVQSLLRFRGEARIAEHLGAIQVADGRIDG